MSPAGNRRGFRDDSGGASEKLLRLPSGGTRIAAFGVLAAGCAISLALNWPGQLSYDSVVQLNDGRTGHYNAWHPPVMAWMLGIADSLLHGAGLFVLFDTLLFFASLASLLWLVRRPRWPALGAAVFCSALPQVLLYQGIVWKDVLFADTAIAGFVLLAHFAVADPAGWKRWLFLAAAFASLALATLVRQNGFVVLPFGAIAVLAGARRQGSNWPRAHLLAAAALAAAACAVVFANLALATRTVGAPQPAGQIRLLELYDLIGEIKIDPALPLASLERSDPSLASLIRSDGVRLYTPVRNDALFASAKLQEALADASATSIESQWAQVLIAHPAIYLRTRAQDFVWVFATPQLRQCMPWYTGVTGPPAVLRELGLAPRFRPQDGALAAYAAAIARTPLYSHVLYALFALGLLAFLLWRRRPGDIAMACLLGAALLYTLSYFVISIACDYRYLLVLDLSALTALFHCATTAGGRDGEGT